MYWLATVYALGNPRTRGVGKAMTSYGVRVSVNIAKETLKGTYRGVAQTPFVKGGKTPGQFLRSGVRVGGRKVASGLVPGLLAIDMAYTTSYLGGAIMEKNVPEDVEQQKQLGKLLMHPTGR